MIKQAQQNKPQQLSMTIDGHKVTISFANEATPHISQLVRNTLLDSYIKQNDICSEGSS